MGKVRPSYIKSTARKLIEAYPDKFTTDFETNKNLVKELTNIESKKVKNRIAGYITRLMKQKKQKEKLVSQSIST